MGEYDQGGGRACWESMAMKAGRRMGECEQGGGRGGWVRGIREKEEEAWWV